MKIFLFSIIATTLLNLGVSAQTSVLKVTTSVAENVQNEFVGQGRIFLFVTNSLHSEPRFNTWPVKSNKIYAINLENWCKDETFTFGGDVRLTKSVNINLDSLPRGKYRVQVLWDQDTKASRINAAGNLYSNAVTIDLKGDKLIDLPLEKVIKKRKLAENKFLKKVDIKSSLLSEWWGKEMRLKAAVLLPGSYFNNPARKYPVRYNIAGYGGRYTRANRYVMHNTTFLNWWLSADAPQIINVFLDGEGPFGDCYQLDSGNSGPYGSALTKELIPFIEKKYRGEGTPESRFVDGCSTGGWVSLALQIFYPDFFNGCFSYSPDQVDFENCQLINIYKDKNAFYNEFGYLRPIVRDVTGEPMVSQKDFIRFENVLGTSNTYLNSGGQFCAFTALFSPKGDNGLPKPLFDPITGDIDREVAEYWKKHDLKLYVEKNWTTLGPKLKGKIWVWGADMDTYYLNPALRAFNAMLKKMNHPKSDASIHFTPMAGHCAEYNFKKVLLQIADKLKQ